MNKPNKYIIDQGVKICGHLIPLDKRLNCYQFSDIIKGRLSLSNPITQRIYIEVRESTELYYKRSKSGVKVVSI